MRYPYKTITHIHVEATLPVLHQAVGNHHIWERATMGDHLTTAAIVVMKNPCMPVNTFMHAYMCIIPDNDEHIQMCHDAFGIGDEMNTLHFLAC